MCNICRYKHHKMPINSYYWLEQILLWNKLKWECQLFGNIFLISMRVLVRTGEISAFKIILKTKHDRKYPIDRDFLLFWIFAPILMTFTQKRSAELGYSVLE